MQPVSYATYQSTPTGGIALWIQGKTSWSQYAAVPQGSIVPLLAVSSTGGNGNLKFIDADGKSYDYNYYFYPYSRLTFYADLPGRHFLTFTVNGKTSNQVIIDVTGDYVSPNNYLPQPIYLNYYNDYFPYGYGYYPYDYYPGGTYYFTQPFNSSSDLSKFGSRQHLVAPYIGYSTPEMQDIISEEEAYAFLNS